MGVKLRRLEAGDVLLPNDGQYPDDGVIIVSGPWGDSADPSYEMRLLNDRSGARLSLFARELPGYRRLRPEERIRILPMDDGRWGVEVDGGAAWPFPDRQSAELMAEAVESGEVLPAENWSLDNNALVHPMLGLRVYLIIENPGYSGGYRIDLVPRHSGNAPLGIAASPEDAAERAATRERGNPWV